MVDAVIRVLPLIRKELRDIGDRLYDAGDNPHLLTVIEVKYDLIKSQVDSLVGTGYISSDTENYCCETLKSARVKLDEAKKHVPERKGIFDKFKAAKRAKTARKALNELELLLKGVLDFLESTLDGPLANIHAHSFNAFFDTPPLPENAYFEETDTTSSFGKLKDLVVGNVRNSFSSANIPIFCAKGPGGMGKTVVLRKLCHDPDVKRRFKHGIHYLSLGRDASNEDILSLLRVCAENAHLKSSTTGDAAEMVQHFTDLSRALNKLRAVFQEKTVLFVLDDLWSRHRPFLQGIVQIFTAGHSCAVVCATQLEEVSLVCTHPISIDYIDSTGSQARGILLNQLTKVTESDLQSFGESAEAEASLRQGLLKCGGWVLCLNISGVYINQLIDPVTRDVAQAVAKWSAHLQSGSWNDSERPSKSYDFTLTKMVRRSLTHCTEQWCHCAPETPGDMLEFFRALSVMQKLKPLPREVLSYLWRVSPEDAWRIAEVLNDASLVSIDRDTFHIRMHDKLIDMSRTMAASCGGIAAHHQTLLKGFLDSDANFAFDGYGSCRMWWDDTLVDGPYLCENLGYHLAEAELYEELWCLLTDVRWLLRWLCEQRSWANLSKDFGRCLSTPGSWIHLDSCEGLQSLHRAIHDAWHCISIDKHCLGFEICSRLSIPAFPSGSKMMQSIERWGPTPWLRPYIAESESGLLSRMHIPAENVENMAFSCNGRYGGWLENSNEAVIYDIHNQLIIQRKTLSGDRFLLSAVSNDGCLIISGDLHDLFLSNVTTSSTVAEHLIGQHDRDSWAAAFSPDSTLLVANAEDGALRVCEISNWQEIRGVVLDSEQEDITSLLFSPDGRKVVSTSKDSTAIVWDFGVSIEEFRRETFDMNMISEKRSRPSSVLCAAFTNDGKVLATGSVDGSVVIWDLEHDREPAQHSHHNGPMECVAFNSSGTMLVSGGGHRTVIVRDIASGEEGEFWNLSIDKGDEELDLISRASSPSYVEFEEGNDRVVRCATEGGRIVVWEFALAGGISREPSWITHRSPVRCVRFSDDGERLLSGEGFVGKVVCGDVQTGSFGALQSHAPMMLDVLEGFRDLTLSLTHLAFGLSRSLVVWDIADLRLAAKRLELPAHNSFVTCLAFSSDGSRLVAGHHNGQVRVWDLRVGDGQEAMELNGGVGSVRCVAFCGSEQRVVAGGHRGQVALWQLTSRAGTEEALHLAGCVGKVVYLACSLDGNVVVATDEEGKLCVWDVRDGAEMMMSMFLWHGGGRSVPADRYDAWLDDVSHNVIRSGGFGRRELDDLLRGVMCHDVRIDDREGAEERVVLTRDRQMLMVGKGNVRAYTEGGEVVVANMPYGCSFDWNDKRNMIAHGLTTGRVIISEVVCRGSEQLTQIETSASEFETSTTAAAAAKNKFVEMVWMSWWIVGAVIVLALSLLWLKL